MVGFDVVSGRWTSVLLCIGLLGCGPAVDNNSNGSGGGPGAEDESSSGGSVSSNPSEPEPDTSLSGASAETDTAMTEPPPPDPDPDPDPDTGVPPDDDAIDGPYLVAFWTTVAPETPFQFVADVTVVDDVLDMTLVPLSLGVGSTDAPREELPEFSLSFVDVPIASDGTYMLELPETFLPGATNPITGSDIVADLRIVGWFNGQRMCGNLSGAITVPANIDLTGSSLAGVPVDNGVLPPVANAVCG